MKKHSFFPLLLFFITTSVFAEVVIPTVSMQDFYSPEKKEEFLKTLYHAMTTIGFFGVEKTEVNQTLIDLAYKESSSFFKSDLSYKKQFYSSKADGQRGFVLGEFAKGNATKDRKEFFLIGKEGSHYENIWSDKEEFKIVFSQFYDALSHYVYFLQTAILEAINYHHQTNIDPHLLNNTLEGGDSLLRLIYYPAMEPTNLCSTAPIYWAAPHTDIDYLTILPKATEEGLQVEINGEWHDVKVKEDAFVINIGDMITNLTNGLLKSSKHRVIAKKADAERFSMVFFVHPHPNTPLDPIQSCIDITGGKQIYGNGTQKEFLWERLLELGIGGADLLYKYHQTNHVRKQMLYNKESPQVVDLLKKEGLL